MKSYKLYLLILTTLTLLSLILCIITKVKLIDKNNYCNKTETELCNEPEIINIKDIEYLSCKNAKKLNIKNNSMFIKYFLVPLIIIIIILSIILIFYDINKSGLSFINLIIPIFNVIALIILIIFQLIFYFTYKKKCLDNTYHCNLVSNLEYKNNNYNIGKIDTKCKPKMHKRANKTYKIIKNFNRFLFAVLIFSIYIILYNLDIVFNIMNFSSKDYKFSSKINPFKYITAVTVIFFINLLFPNSIGSYLINSLFILIIIVLLGYYEYYDVNFLNFCK